MIPYIIINGVLSKTINGLLIQSLPPISKPKVRTSIEEIDGRDGDIVTRLGYGAYDKVLSIGLRGEYDIDDVIKFFDTSGKIIFSNELDKYYNFAIYDTIDFNRLVRFRTANVNIHVQPFKYSADEPPITWVNSEGETTNDLMIRNNGNTISKPILTFKGTGDINFYINNEWVLKAALSTDETMIIDTNTMNATNPSGDFTNRQVTGDYNDLNFKSGLNTLRVTGDIDDIKIENYSRWI